MNEEREVKIFANRMAKEHEGLFPGTHHPY